MFDFGPAICTGLSTAVVGPPIRVIVTWTVWSPPKA